MSTSTLFLTAFVVLQIATLFRVMLRPHREPAARIAWIAVVTGVPFFGVLAYLFFGEVNVGSKHIARMRTVLAAMPKLSPPKPDAEHPEITRVPHKYEHLFRLGKSINGFEPVGGNTASMMANSDAMIDALVADIEAAKKHVHLLFYIWLPDNNGCKVAEALKRAAARGVTCRAMADNMGSRTIIRSHHWQDMQKAGVKMAILLPIGNPFLRVLIGRIDLRNHRKIVVIDGCITYCGSQNCADAEFLPKPKFAPWVDAVLRLEGPVAHQNQHLFVSDWMTATSENISELLRHRPEPGPAPAATDIVAQVIGTGPTDRHLAMPQMFVALITSARRELTITTPYFVPNEPIQSALQAAAHRDVRVTLVVPARNDSPIVQGASRSFYADLLEAGIRIFEYQDGLLHAKLLTLDGDFAMIGSANLDRRSFDLNYENNMLIHDPATVADIMERQQQYISQSEQVQQSTVKSWPATTRLWNNTLAVLGPIL